VTTVELITALFYDLNFAQKERGSKLSKLLSTWHTS
jgi:hypothetical protein